VSAALETARLTLRPFAPDDLAVYERLNADPKVRRYLGGVLSADAARAEMEEIADFHARSGLGMIPVVRRSDGMFLGTCGLSRVPWYPDEIEIGWRLLPEFWGQGYATEAATAWRDHAFGRLDMPQLISVADVPNVRSHRVMQRLGMLWHHSAVLEEGGERFEAHIYAMTAEAWRAGRTKL
jgi:RimJ/RimL family protein N-acetyltransferase